jgi:hypothetical protein
MCSGASATLSASLPGCTLAACILRRLRWTDHEEPCQDSAGDNVASLAAGLWVIAIVRGGWAQGRGGSVSFVQTGVGSWSGITQSRRGGGPLSKIRPVRQRTGAPRQGGGPGTGAALLAGAVPGLATDAMTLALPRQQARRLSGAGLAAAAGIYAGFAVADGRRSARLVQAGELLGFTALAVLAVQRDSPGLLGDGWLAHVTWDALHYQGRGPTRVRSWYPPFCISYDVALAAPLLTGRL